MTRTNSERLVGLEARMSAVEEGVSNFRKFQTKVSTHVDTYNEREDAREKTDKKRARIHFALLGALLAIVSGCAIALFSWVLDGHHTVSTASHISQTQPQDATATSVHY